MKNSTHIFHVLLAVAILAITLFAQERPVTAPCSCPKFRVEADWEVVKAGDLVEFSVPSVEFDGLLFPARRFEWTVSRGTIVSGQNTSKILVQTTADMLTAPTASPTPLPDPGQHGFVIWGGRPSVEIEATAKYVGAGNCTCGEVSATVQVGAHSVRPNRPADMTGLKLSANNFVAPCEPGREPAAGVKVSESMIVDVAASATDPDDDVLTYEYTVSGGRLIGRGANVKWDLAGVAPGTYTITAGVDDGCGLCGKTWTAEVKVVACEPFCSLVNCPTLEMRGPDLLGKESVFIAIISGGSQTEITYTWSVNDGEILSGQGTPIARAKLARNGSVMVKIGGLDPNGHCMESVTKEYKDGRLKP